MLEVRAYAKKWPGLSLSVDLELGDGEIGAILGPSGCGKSTLLRLLAGLTMPDGGTASLDDKNLAGLPPEKRGIGMVFQDLALFPQMSVRQNIEYGPSRIGAGRGEKRAIAEALAAAFGIAELLDRRPGELSGGEAQRVALARTLALKPGLVLLDEPLSSLDASLRKRLRSEIAERLRDAGASVLHVTHDVEEAFAVADRIFLMRAGKIVSSGVPEEIYARPANAWAAAFLSLGPVLPVSRVERSPEGIIARTAIGNFACTYGGEEHARDTSLSLFFHADAALIQDLSERAHKSGKAGGEPQHNILQGIVASSSFAGRTRRIALDCPAEGTATRIEIDMPSSFRPGRGDSIELFVPAERCKLLPGTANEPISGSLSRSP